MRTITPPSRCGLLLTAILAFCLAPRAHCRLGETEAELGKRFGAPRTQAQDTLLAAGKIIRLWPKLTYSQDDWTIACDIVEGRCARATYQKPGEWTDDHFLAALNANAQGATWTEVSDARFKTVKREWKRSDGATGLWRKGVGLTLTTPAYVRAKETAAAKAKAQSQQIPKL
ncbi:MAG: hypothetical protein JNK23_04265 [Opitutaceae bacterium]|nr:hypothetical protein [Opitutaceae bacterium]